MASFASSGRCLSNHIPAFIRGKDAPSLTRILSRELEAEPTMAVQVRSVPPDTPDIRSRVRESPGITPASSQELNSYGNVI